MCLRQERFYDADVEYLVLGPDGVSPTGAKAPVASGASSKANNKVCAFSKPWL